MYFARSGSPGIRTVGAKSPGSAFMCLVAIRLSPDPVYPASSDLTASAAPTLVASGQIRILTPWAAALVRSSFSRPSTERTGNDMSNYLIPCPSDRAETLTRERVHITEQLNDAAVPEVSLAQARVAPGVTTELHSLLVAEWYVVISGHGKMEVDGEPPFAVAPGDSVAIPQGVSQRITNVGQVDLVFQCICLPRFVPEAYAALE